MTGSEKFTWGLVLSVGGSLAFVGGIALSITLIGACLGIPMAVIGFPLMIWGTVWAYQGRLEKAQEVITAGIREGITAAQAAHVQPLTTVTVAASGKPAELAPAQSSESTISERRALPESVGAQGDERTAPQTSSEQAAAEETVRARAGAEPVA